jgi:3-hydroxypropanoate dehydrogenase
MDFAKRVVYASDSSRGAIMNNQRVTDDCLDILFRNARSHSFWLDRPVSDEQLRQLYDLMKWGPTSANTCPARLLFLRTHAAKERLRPCLDPGNVEKSMTAPVVAVIGMDMEFHLQLGRLFPHNQEAPSWFAGKPAKIEETAFRNGTLQGAYFLLAARAFGLDCGPMSGFNRARLDAEFFPDGKVRSNFLCALGYADHARLFPRSPRLGFDEACRLL